MPSPPTDPPAFGVPGWLAPFESRWSGRAPRGPDPTPAPESRPEPGTDAPPEPEADPTPEAHRSGRISTVTRARTRTRTRTTRPTALRLGRFAGLWLGAAGCSPPADPTPGAPLDSGTRPDDDGDDGDPNPDTGSGDTGGTGDTGDAPAGPRWNWMNPHGGDQADLWTADTEWAETRAQTDVVSFYVQAVGDDHRGHVTTAVQALTRLDIGIAVEAGGTLASVGCGDDVGARSAEVELARLETLTAAGGRLAALSLDGPISRTVASGRADNCGFTVARSAAALADYIQAVRAVHPDVQIGWLVNFPNWSYGDTAAYQCATKDYGDLEQVLEEVLSVLDDRGARLDYFMVDQPYDYTLGLVDSNCHPDPSRVDWMGRLRALEDQARGHGLQVAQIYNSSRGGATSNALFHDDTVAYAEAHRAAGGRPDIRLVSSWYTYPDRVLPETDAHTFTHTALATWAAADGRTAGR